MTPPPATPGPAADVEATPQRTREQVVAQYRVVAHLARQIAIVHEQCAETYGHPDVPLEPGFIDMLGDQSAARMETLGDMLNSMDAVEEEDAWTNPIFHIAQATWPQQQENAALAEAREEGWRTGIEEAASLFDNRHEDGRRIIVGKVNLSCAEARHVASAIKSIPTPSTTTPREGET